jgi:hypothetical protein
MGMILTIQTINHFVKQIGAKFTIEYKVETYKDDNGNMEKIASNQPTAFLRDEWLKELTNAWINDLSETDNIEGTLIPIVSADKRALTHWRELSFICGSKKLSIYPDGGFINEWLIARQPDGVFYDTSNIKYDTNICLYRNKDIKFDLTIEDC